MAKPSHREKLLSEGLKVVHRLGLGGASVRDIVQAAGVPQGSFTNHFASKEAFGLEVLELYFAKARDVIAATLLNEALAPLQRLRAYIDANIAFMKAYEMNNGCMLGNTSAESGAQSDVIRLRLSAMLDDVQHDIAQCLRAAVRSGDLPKGYKSTDVAGFIVSSLQGAYLIAKAQRDIAPMERFRQVLFSSVLR